MPIGFESFSANSLDGFLITNSLVGLGLIIAVYSFISPWIDRFLANRQESLKLAIRKRDEIFKELSKDKNNEVISKNYRKYQRIVNGLTKIPFHLGLGYQIPSILFFYSLLMSVVRILTPMENVNYQSFGMVSFTFFIFGALFFAFSLLFLLKEIKDFNLQKFEDIRKKEEKKEEIIKKELKKLKKAR